MTAVPVAQRMTAEEFLALPESPPARRHELVEGELIAHEARALHGDVQRDLLVALVMWTRAEPGRGAAAWPRDVRLDERNVFAPDVLWYREERVWNRNDPAPYPMPDLAVEIRSPPTRKYDIGAKKSAYERHGLPELWLVDTVAEEVLVFRRSAPDRASFDVAVELGRGEALTSPLLPGFELSLDELFPS